MNFRNRVLFVVVLFNVILTIFAVNHWVLNDNGLITAKIDSPFYLREPQNLATFIDQIKHNEIVENTYSDLLRQRESMMEQINHSIQFSTEVIEQTKCAFGSFDPENTLTYTRLTRDYLKRFGRDAKYELLVKPEPPHCWRFLKFNIGMCCFDHLPSLENPKLLEITPEDELRDEELEIDSEYFVSDIIAGLRKNPNSWRFHTLASYYWRMKGNAYEAIECARRGVLLAPRDVKDIALLSLGTILWRAEQLKDAHIVLSAAVDHAPHIPENRLALGTTLAMLHDFNRSVQHLQLVEKLEASYSQKISNLKNFVMCLDNLEKKTEKMESFVEYFKKEVNGLRRMKNKITKSHERLIQQQVPLGARYFDPDINNEPLVHRGQYCSPRTLAGSEEPVLFCDFYSDIQMRLESKEVDIESLEREISLHSDAIKKRLTQEFQSQFNFQKMKRTTRRD